MTRARGRHGRRRPLAGLTVAVLVVALVAGTAALTWASGAIQSPATTSAASIQPPVTGNPAVSTLLGRMSMAEKFRLLEWVTAPGNPQTATLPGLRRLGIPALHLAEGPLGTARQPSAAMTAPLGVAATFSRADAYANGVVLGRDARALGEQAVARPFGAIGTGTIGTGAAVGASFGEDPLLAGGTAAAEIAGIQAQGTMAVAGDYPAGPGNPGVVPSSAALHEIYLQPVEDAVRAGASGVLCSPAAGPGAAAVPAGNAIPPAATPAGPGTVRTGSATAPGTTVPTGSATAPGTTVRTGSATAPGTTVRTGSATAPGTTVPTGSATAPATTVPTGSATAPATTVPTGSATATAGPGPAYASGSTSAPARKQAGPAPCGNPGLLIQILRSELGFTGFVLAGPGANPGTLSLDSGLDGEVPAAGRAAARYFTPAALHAAIATKTITTATVNQAVAVVLTEMDRFGLLGPQPAHAAAAEPAAADERVLSRTATDAATLLRNSGHALPLTPAALSSLALIGPGANQVIGTGPAGGAEGPVSQPPGTLQVLRQDLASDPAAHLSFAVGDDMTGTPVPGSVLTHEGLPGLVRSSTGHDATRVVSVLDNTLAGHDALPAGSGHTWPAN